LEHPTWGHVSPRRTATTPLYPVVQHGLETVLSHAADSDPTGSGAPSWVEKDFRAYLRCGILAHGFARASCADCGHERLIPLSCKGRGTRHRAASAGATPASHPGVPSDLLSLRHATTTGGAEAAYHCILCAGTKRAN
jgi:hypothetical protein